MVTTAKGESRDRACTGMTEPQQLVLEEHSLSASRPLRLSKAALVIPALSRDLLANLKNLSPESKIPEMFFYIHNTMKFIRTLVLLFVLVLPSVSLAEENSVYTPKTKATDYIPMPLGIEIGGGSMFVAGLEWGSPLSLIYEQKRPKGIEGLWAPDYAFVWSIRTRYVYDYIDHEHGALLYPNIQYLRFFFGVAVGPQVGWFSSTGFDYGASVRLDLMCLLNVEAGYFFEKKTPYVSFLFSFSILRFGPFDP